MRLQGLTTEYSLPELFKFIKDSRQTGRLSFQVLADDARLADDVSKKGAHYFWFEAGKVIAVSNRLDGLGLLTLLQRRSFLPMGILPRLLRQCPPRVTLGSFLQEKGVISGKQLQYLFAMQVLNTACNLMSAGDAQFMFHPSAALPYLEMTGEKIRATDVALPSLRMLRSWDRLQEKLPALESGLRRVSEEAPQYKLNRQEAKVLKLSQAEQSLKQIAAALVLPEIEVQKIGFRLIYVGIVQELPLIAVDWTETQAIALASPKVSDRFLSNLTDYLQKTNDAKSLVDADVATVEAESPPPLLPASSSST